MKKIKALTGFLLFSGCVNEASLVPEVVSTSEKVASQEFDNAAAGNPVVAKDKQDPNMPPENANTKYNELSDFEKYVIEEKGTERAFAGEYTDTEAAGTYICRRCNAKLYKSDHKFHSNCGWPAFDDEIEGAVHRNVDADGYRVEIVCANADGHLGHVFEGEGLTKKNVRHCVNSVSMKFVPKGQQIPATIKPDAGK